MEDQTYETYQTEQNFDFEDIQINDEQKECWWIQLTKFIRNEEDNTYNTQKVLLFIGVIILVIILLTIIFKIIKRINRKIQSNKYVAQVASSRQHSMMSPLNSVHLNSQSLKSQKSISITSRSVSLQSLPSVRSSSNLSNHFQNTEIQDFENNLERSHCVGVEVLSKNRNEMSGIDDKDD